MIYFTRKPLYSKFPSVNGPALIIIHGDATLGGSDDDVSWSRPRCGDYNVTLSTSAPSYLWANHWNQWRCLFLSEGMTPQQEGGVLQRVERVAVVPGNNIMSTASDTVTAPEVGLRGGVADFTEGFASYSVASVCVCLSVNFRGRGGGA